MDYTILVNKEHEIPALNFKYTSFIDVFNRDCQLEEKTYAAYLELQAYLKTKGLNIDIESGLRTTEYQKGLFDEMVAKKGLEYAKMYVALPKHSEHETGLAIDICVVSDGKVFVEYDILEKDVKLLHEAINQFGFILRYPLGKESITGYNYELWHIRYVGVPLAHEIAKSGLTFDEWKNK